MRLKLTNLIPYDNNIKYHVMVLDHLDHEYDHDDDCGDHDWDCEWGTGSAG